MSGSEDTSDFTMSPSSQSSPPYSSPSQQVPQLANYIAGLSCAETLLRKGPHLVIEEEPMNHFRFRYKSEMIGTHGCLLGASYATSKSKTHPTVELRNYSGKAEIRCTLVRHDNDKEHPHRLQDDHDRDVSSLVPDQGSYKVAFNGMGIIHTAKKDVPTVLLNKKLDQPEYKSMREEVLRVMCQNEAREINLNIVRLKFSAYDLAGAPLCPPVFSQPISNLKSAATNDLRICRMSQLSGRAEGGDDVFLLVEKVKKTNIMVRMFELDEAGRRGWCAKGKFLQTDVHHQYAIVFNTPPYKDRKITADVQVFVELFRPSDGRSSEPRLFTYKAHPMYRQLKKRKANSYSSIESNNSLKSLSEFPATIADLNGVGNTDKQELDAINPLFTIKIPAPEESPENLIGDAMLYDIAPAAPAPPFACAPHKMADASCDKMSDGAVFVDGFNSSEIARLLEPNPDISAEEKRLLMDVDYNEYMTSFPSDLTDGMKYIKCALVGDSGRAMPKPKPEPTSEPRVKTERTERAERAECTLERAECTLERTECTPEPADADADVYTAVYSAENGAEVKQLVKEICYMIRTKSGHKREVCAKLERLCDMRLSNGDTFLHMSLCSNQPSLESIVRLVHSAGMSHLLNLRNHAGQTLLHLATLGDSPLVPFLVSKGCDPMVRDGAGNTALHCAAPLACVEPLLRAAASCHLDLDALNYEERSALHVAASSGNCAGVRALLRAGAAPDVRGAGGRTPLHAAALAASLPVVRALLDPEREGLTPDVEAADDNGYTALLMACDAAESDSSVRIVQLLLDAGADAGARTLAGEAACSLARHNPRTLAELRRRAPAHAPALDDVKSEPDDDDSADDDDMDADAYVHARLGADARAAACRELPLYEAAVAAALDGGAWRELARRLSRAAMAGWYARAASPTSALLRHVQSEDEALSSRSLALLLEDMGERDAAAAVRRHIS